MSKKVMKLLDPSSGLMECKVCGARHYASMKSGGHYKYGSWQCQNKCKLEDSSGSNYELDDKGTLKKKD